MPRLAVDGLQFDFPAGWSASKYDEWAYYRNQFARQGNHLQAVDVIAVSPAGDAYLVEVKDYRHPDTEKPSQLHEALFNKVICTLAALLPASLHAADEEKQHARAALDCTRLKIVLHIEQPRAHRPAVNLGDLKQKLKSRLKAIDPHVKIVHMQKMAGLEWTVG